MSGCALRSRSASRPNARESGRHGSASANPNLCSWVIGVLATVAPRDRVSVTAWSVGCTVASAPSVFGALAYELLFRIRIHELDCDGCRALVRWFRLSVLRPCVPRFRVTAEVQIRKARETSV